MLLSEYRCSSPQLEMVGTRKVKAPSPARAAEDFVSVIARVVSGQGDWTVFVEGVEYVVTVRWRPLIVAVQAPVPIEKEIAESIEQAIQMVVRAEEFEITDEPSV